MAHLRKVDNNLSAIPRLSLFRHIQEIALELSVTSIWIMPSPVSPQTTEEITRGNSSMSAIMILCWCRGTKGSRRLLIGHHINSRLAQLIQETLVSVASPGNHKTRSRMIGPLSLIWSGRRSNRKPLSELLVPSTVFNVRRANPTVFQNALQISAPSHRIHKDDSSG